jgi:hypothetical protein
LLLGSLAPAAVPVTFRAGSSAVRARTARRVSALAAIELVALMALAPAVARAEPVGASPGARLTNREFGDRSRRWLMSLGPRKRRTNEWTMHGPLVLSVSVLRLHVLPGIPRIRGILRIRGVSRILRVVLSAGHIVFVRDRCACFDRLAGDDPLRSTRSNLCVERRRRLVLASLARNLRVLVLVLGIARRTARLFDLVPDHRHDSVIGHAPLARAVVIQNVTKPKLALLHQHSRDTAGGEKKSRKANDLSTLPLPAANFALRRGGDPRRRAPSIGACASR